MIYTDIVDSYRQLQELNMALVAGLQGTGDNPLDRMAMGVALVITETMLPIVPVWTGTLQAAQTIIPEEGQGEVIITTARRRNPLGGAYADQYVLDVVRRNDFYSEAVASTPDWAEEAFGEFEAWVGQLL